ncbi:MAG TPA: serine/threonine-protein kinase [Anaerolineaceae bacterium]
MSTIIGSYRIVEEIGGGGFGTVYTARDLSANDYVALKVLNTEMSAKPEVARSFQQEAQTLRGLPAHPNIVRLRDFGFANQKFYLVMDYVPGKDLSDILLDAGVSPQRAFQIAQGVASALEAAAQAGLVHCDIKPANIRICSDQAGTVKVMDFGIARAADSSFVALAGTYAYMAPEVWSGKPPQPATDIYALGCVLYEMLTQHPPFIAQTADKQARRAEYAYMHIHSEPDLSPFSQAGASPLLFTLLKSMLAKDPFERPSAGKVRKDLARLEKEASIQGIARSGSLTGMVDQDEDTGTRLHPLAVPQTDENQTILKIIPAPSVSSDFRLSTDSLPVLKAISSDALVDIQRHLATVNLGMDTSRSAVIHQESLFVGTMDGKIHRLDLRTGRSDHWQIAQAGEVRSASWMIATHPGHLLFHCGGNTWFEISISNGQITRRGELPEAGMNLVIVGEWLYLAGARSTRLFRAPLQTPDRRIEYDLEARLTGTPLAIHGAVFAPTARGMVWIDTGARKVKRIGSEQVVRFICPMRQNRLVVIYTRVQEDGTQLNRMTLYNLSPQLPQLETETEFSGILMGAPLTASQRVMAAMRDGTIRVWDVITGKEGKIEFQPGWQKQVGGGSGLSSPAAINGMLLAVGACSETGRENAGSLAILSASSGKILLEQPVNGDIFISPLWLDQSLAVVTARGTVEIFRISLLSSGKAI